MKETKSAIAKTETKEKISNAETAGKHAREVLKLSNVCKKYEMGDTVVEALSDVNISVLKGESVAIMGPSGSGKSTMLHMLGCLDRPTSGTISIDGITTSSLDDDELSKVRNKKIGFVFQSFFLIPTLTVLENVALPMSFAGFDSEEQARRATFLLQRVGLGDRMHHKPSELSGGQRQRAAIARSLVNNPAIILADEPTGNLDSKSGISIMQLFEELHKEGRTIITVTHDANIVKHAQRVIYLKDGKVVKSL